MKDLVMKRNLRLMLAVASFALLVMNANAAEPTADSLDLVKKNLTDKKAVLLDVRELDEWNRGHLKDASHLALSQIKKGMTAEELAKITGKDTIIYLHCAAGARSLQAADNLAKTARDLRPLKPGYEALLNAGFPKAP
jgi:rhodanese-related sulfurtransferase